ncbi:DoxX family protein [Micromonospora sp. CPCC 206060]|uniref:DoxX family protein n=1 Tax=Micromonospora sp. CPCC 206060 TaxID=3122406 RepID=UPI002FF35075
MNVLLWIVQIGIAVAFTSAGLVKLTQSVAKLRDGMPWARAVPGFAVRALGAVELLTAIGLVVPAATGTASVLTPVAALVVVLIMIGSVPVFAGTGDRVAIALSLLVLVLAALVAWARFGPYPV